MLTERTDTTAENGAHYGVCPPWLIRYFDNSLRRLFQNPDRLFGPYVEPGMTAVDVGCGGGFASLGLARLVGDRGTVIAADLQPAMLDIVRERARRAGLTGRIRLHRCAPDRIGVAGPVDFVLAFWMLHEVPNGAGFCAEVSAMLAPGGRFYVAEPLIHTTGRDFENLIENAAAAGLIPVARPRVTFSRAVVFQKNDGIKRRNRA